MDLVNTEALFRSVSMSSFVDRGACMIHKERLRLPHKDKPSTCKKYLLLKVFFPPKILYIEKSMLAQISAVEKMVLASGTHISIRLHSSATRQGTMLQKQKAGFHTKQTEQTATYLLANC